MNIDLTKIIIFTGAVTGAVYMMKFFFAPHNTNTMNSLLPNNNLEIVAESPQNIKNEDILRYLDTVSQNQVKLERKFVEAKYDSDYICTRIEVHSKKNADITIDKITTELANLESKFNETFTYLYSQNQQLALKTDELFIKNQEIIRLLENRPSTGDTLISIGDHIGALAAENTSVLTIVSEGANTFGGF